MNFVPTSEQVRIVDGFRNLGHININAGAGTGKTKSMILCAESMQNRRGIYTTFTKAMVVDADKRLKHLPKIAARTMHSLAYAAEGSIFNERIGNRQRQSNEEVTQILAKMSPKTVKIIIDEVGGVRTFANYFKYTLKNFAKSDSDRVSIEHIPNTWAIVFNGNELMSKELGKVLTALVQQAWDHDICNMEGKLKFEPDYYLKMWQLNQPYIPCDYILFDEIQDADPVMNNIILQQANKFGTQLVYVGDRYQRLYAWRDSIDAAQYLRDIGSTDLYLTKSWRFGNEIANEANKWLKALGAEYTLTGNEEVNSRVVGDGDLEARTILCRTNGGVLGEAVTAMDSGLKFSVPGGASKMVPLKSMAKGAQDLKSGLGTDCPEFFGYKNWTEVEDDPTEELLSFVKLVRRVGTSKIIRACNQATYNEKDADVLISTVHSAKGLEWNTVRVSDDFWSPEPKQKLNKFEGMVGYVASTRAINELDVGVPYNNGRGGLGYIDSVLAEL